MTNGNHEFNHSLDRIQALVESNARSIQALANERRKYEREISRERARLYTAMADLASAQAGFYQRLEEVDQRHNDLSRRQGEIVEILRRLTDREPN